VLARFRPDWVVVQGDTTTAAVGALAAFYAGARVAHVEAGLRSHSPREPFPEEANRRVVGSIADLHLAPTVGARDNLLREGIAPTGIRVTGNPVIDALVEAQSFPLADDSPVHALPSDRRLLLVTAHRRESFGAPLAQICDALVEILDRVPDTHVAFPVHPNPSVRDTVERRLGGHPAITLLPPLRYRDMVEALTRSTIVLSDSGGLQEEAPSIGKPVLVLRGVTERVEGVAAGTVRLVGTQRSRIVREALTLLGSPGEIALMSRAVNPYGDGRAAGRIVTALLGDPVDEWGAGGPTLRTERPRRSAPAPRQALPALTWDLSRF
jgi:UDP-N-acetylglucosamine 2-epimerase (non-hydrolysing)